MSLGFPEFLMVQSRDYVAKAVESNRSQPHTDGLLFQEKPMGIFGPAQEERWVVLDPSSGTLSLHKPSTGWSLAAPRRLDLRRLRGIDRNKYGMLIFLYFEGSFLKFKAKSEEDFTKWWDALRRYIGK